MCEALDQHIRTRARMNERGPIHDGGKPTTRTERMIARRDQHERIARDDLMVEIAELGFQREQRRVERSCFVVAHQHRRRRLLPGQ